MTDTAAEKLRIDKWLWHARLFKSRTLAGKFVASGKLRLNENPVAKARVEVGPGDVLTFPHGDWVKVVKILALGTRRGPAPEARALYEHLSPPRPSKAAQASGPAPREKGAGRPTKAERRALDRLREAD